MGARKIPTNLKVLRGTLKKSRENKFEPQPDLGRPDPPDALDEIGLAKWHETVVELERMGILARVDGTALAGFCDAFSRWYRNAERLKREGDVIESFNGQQMPHPSIGIVNRSLVLLRSFLIEFGLSPSSRANVKTTKATEKRNPFEEILGGKPRR